MWVMVEDFVLLGVMQGHSWGAGLWDSLITGKEQLASSYFLFLFGPHCPPLTAYRKFR
jgi:hypothetical protein